MQIISERKRPVWVWVIAIWFVVGAVVSLASYLAIRSGAIPIKASHQAYLDSLNFIDHAATILLTCMNVLGAIFLFLLRKEAVTLLLGALVLNVLLTTWHVFMKGLASAVSGGFVAIFFGLSLPCMVCYYAWHLKSTKVLT